MPPICSRIACRDELRGLLNALRKLPFASTRIRLVCSLRRRGAMQNKQRYELKQWHVVAVTAILLSVVVFAVCLGILVCLPALIEKNIRDVSERLCVAPLTARTRQPTLKGSMLIEGSPLLPKWTNPKYTIKSRIWTHSVKNPDDVTNGSRPIVKKLGPYVFDQTHRRDVRFMSTQYGRPWRTAAVCRSSQMRTVRSSSTCTRGSISTGKTRARSASFTIVCGFPTCFIRLVTRA